VIPHCLKTAGGKMQRYVGDTRFDDIANTDNNSIHNSRGIFWVPEWAENPKHAMHLVVALVASQYRTEKCNIYMPGRGTRKIRRLRQMAMYLLHTAFSISYNNLAQLFGRDRTTIANACRTIEDLRESRFENNEIARLEEILAIIISQRGLLFRSAMVSS
jgi:chromosomal replication initiation ATPase DnaA